jgi:murein DD-endopeptidase MepM/ murein hydrolase activator NlpD
LREVIHRLPHAVAVAFFVLAACNHHPPSGGTPEPDAGVVHPPGPRLLWRPFVGDYAVQNLFDHDVPLEFVDKNGRQTTYWGGASTFIDGHNGYDFPMPEGTSLKSAVAGKVVFAGEETPWLCPLLNRMVSARFVNVEATASDGVVYQAQYVHLSAFSVAVGDVVQKGEEVGLSGNTGCSTEPHLHFAVLKKDASGHLTVVDPWGWSASTPDPWVTQGGTSSDYLWDDNEAPILHRDASLDLSHNNGGAIAMTNVRWMGEDDASHPNNEYVELTYDPRFASGPVYLNEYALSNLEGDRVDLPTVTLTSAHPVVRVYSGRGTNTDTSIYLGRDQPLWSDTGDCAMLHGPNGYYFYDYFYLSGCTR